MPLRSREQQEFWVEPLARTHDRSVFSCGIAALDRYLRQQAGQDAARQVSVCFILTPNGRTVAGFYTLSQYAVDLAGLTAELASKLPKYPEVPATLLGRLAVGIEFKGRGLGEFLLLDALHRCWKHSNEIASLAVVVDAKDEAAVRFYRHFNFISLPGTPSRLFLPMKTLEKLFV
ncbi:MAG: GNAT family N-acetyltransferase [Anaerolineae bacterium]